MALMKVMMVATCDQVLILGKEEREKQKPYGSR
jgi:hypothetical protein